MQSAKESAGRTPTSKKRGDFAVAICVVKKKCGSKPKKKNAEEGRAVPGVRKRGKIRCRVSQEPGTITLGGCQKTIRKEMKKKSKTCSGNYGGCLREGRRGKNSSSWIISMKKRCSYDGPVRLSPLLFLTP